MWWRLRVFGHTGNCLGWLALAGVGWLCACNRPADTTASLQAALAAQSDAITAQHECTALSADVLDFQRQAVALAATKAATGQVLIVKDHYPEAVAAFKEAAKGYRQVVAGQELLAGAVAAEQALATARDLAEAAAPAPAALADARKLQDHAEQLLRAGELTPALAELRQAVSAWQALAPASGADTLEAAVAARSALLAMRAQLKNAGALAPAPPPSEAVFGLAELRQRLAAGPSSAPPQAGAKDAPASSLAELLARAQAAETAATNALAAHHYGVAAGYYDAGTRWYFAAAARQQRPQDPFAAARQRALASQRAADALLRGASRPAAYERGKQALADADRALAQGDGVTASQCLAQAEAAFNAARTEAPVFNGVVEAQLAWSAALAGADSDQLNRWADDTYAVARQQAAAAQAALAVGQPADAAQRYRGATAVLGDAVARARIRAKRERAEAVFPLLANALAAKDADAAMIRLAELEALAPSDARLPALRAQVVALAGPRRTLTMDLGGGLAAELVEICPGTFVMGSDHGDANERPLHRVTLTQPYYLGKYEVTQEQWQAVMGNNPSSHKGPKLPVDMVNWNDCQDFLAKLNARVPPGKGKFRLPTEAEWEYAGRAGSTTEYFFGDDPAELEDYAWYGGNSEGTTHPVGTKQPNAWGLYDMTGNVLEWCGDGLGPYSADDATDPVGKSTMDLHAARGGDWNDEPLLVRSATRSSNGATFRSRYHGLRLCIQPPATDQPPPKDQ